MTLIVEVLVYILVVLGIMVITITVIDKNNINTPEKSGDDESNVIVEIKVCGKSEKQVQNIAWRIAKGKYTDIYDIADEFKIYMKE
ncbi:MAG: hypothetical protein IKV94_03645 [Clostridia bacterium]|nr:hypothetical protein [Clostridia bacterium]